MDLRAPSSGGQASEKRRSTVVIITLALCGTVVSLQQTLVLPMLPDFPELLDTSANSASWLITATLLSGAVAMPSIARLADMYGKKRLLVLVLAVTVLGSLLGSLSSTLLLVLVARVLQGVGIALIPVGIAIMRDELPRERVPLGVAFMSATLAIGAGIGLPLSGLIAQYLDWRAIFWVTGVVGSVMLVVVLLVLSESPIRTGGTFDYRGALVLSAALTAVLLAVSKGGHWGWASPTTLLLGGSGVLLLAIYVPLEKRVPNPLIDVRLAARPSVLLVNIASILGGFAMFSNMLVTTQLLQLPASTGFGLELDILQTGLWMAPSALAFGALAPVSAAMTQRWSPQTTLFVGALVMAFSYVARVFFSQTLWQIVAGTVLVSMGTAMAYAALPVLIMRAVPVTETASANGLNTLLRSVGTSSSSAATAAVTALGVVSVGDQVFPSADSLMMIFWASSAAAMIIAVLSLPMFRMRAYVEDPREEVGHMGDAVVRGQVVSVTGAPIDHAVVSFLTTAGQQVGWGTVNTCGIFTVAVPNLGRHLVVAAADGWRPQSCLIDLAAETEIQQIILSEQLTLSGTVTDHTDPTAGALVVLTRQSGGVVTRACTDGAGRYQMPLPSNGQYVLSALGPTDKTAVRAVTVWGATLTLDLELRKSARVPPRDDTELRETVR